MYLSEFTPARPSRVENSLRVRPASGGAEWRRLYLKTADLPLAHIAACFGSGYRLVEVPASRAEFNRCLEFPGALPDGVGELVSLLGSGLCLPAPAPFDLVLALDRYKTVDDELPPSQWKNTDVGELVYRAKYYVFSPGAQRRARKALAARLADAIGKHPAYRDAPYLLSVPGSAGDGNSTGELLARLVAESTSKQLIETIGPARAQRKADPSLDVSGMFSSPTMLDGACVIIDDVWHTGGTCTEVAHVAKRAGADAVYGLVGARTMRN
ncbi:hypothetical protein [Tsukamurella sp. PLM1]|uniref:hypothetical protein n=1 Tax=Tsukamurella sp. PLM1 TaxID=2929795 RepID=UPI002060F450|nr:hypothetical protein [Tsukamurella sp. PLM1]BDH59751.1 hypothetical protein MTP03_46900 [Tsukamurella sp. PLM1]